MSFYKHCIRQMQAFLDEKGCITKILFSAFGKPLFVQINPCDADPCIHGSCSDLSGPSAFSCSCDPGWTGTYCQYNIDVLQKYFFQPSVSLSVYKSTPVTLTLASMAPVVT